MSFSASRIETLDSAQVLTGWKFASVLKKKLCPKQKMEKWSSRSRQPSSRELKLKCRGQQDGDIRIRLTELRELEHSIQQYRTQRILRVNAADPLSKNTWDKITLFFSWRETVPFYNQKSPEPTEQRLFRRSQEKR